MASFSNPNKTYAKDKLSVGFINPGSLADRLPNKGSAQADNVQLIGPA